MKKIILAVILFYMLTPSGYATTFSEKAFRVKITGKGQPMLFIPGATCSGDEWDSAVAHYSKKYQCHVFTLAGYAGVEPLNQPPYLPVFASAISNYISDHKLKNVILVGHSIGGYLSLKLASLPKDILEKVIVVDAMPFYAGVLNPTAKSGFNEEQAKNMLLSYNNMNNEQLKNFQFGIAKTMCADSAKWDSIATWGARSDRKTMAYTMAEMMGDDIRQEIAAIKVPVLVLAAFQSMAQYPGFTREYVKTIFTQQYSQCKTCEISVSPSAKHFINYDAPEWLLSEIDTFIGKSQH